MQEEDRKRDKIKKSVKIDSSDKQVENLPTMSYRSNTKLWNRTITYKSKTNIENTVINSSELC